MMDDFNAKLGCGGRTEGRYTGTNNDRSDRTAAVVETKRLFVVNTWFRKKVGRRWAWIPRNAKSKSEIDYVLINEWRILRNSVVLSAGCDRRVLRAPRIHVIPAVEKRVLKCIESAQKGPWLLMGRSSCERATDDSGR